MSFLSTLSLLSLSALLIAFDHQTAEQSHASIWPRRQIGIANWFWPTELQLWSVPVAPQKYAAACWVADAALTSSSTLSNSLIGLCSLGPNKLHRATARKWLKKMNCFSGSCGASNVSLFQHDSEPFPLCFLNWFIWRRLSTHQFTLFAGSYPRMANFHLQSQASCLKIARVEWIFKLCECSLQDLNFMKTFANMYLISKGFEVLK